MTAASDNREKLAIFAGQLRELYLRELRERSAGAPGKVLPWSLSPELSNFIATAIEQYLAGKQKSLDRALGLPAKRGRRLSKPKLRKQEQLTDRILEARLRGKSWKDIADEENKDERELRRIYERHGARVLVAMAVLAEKRIEQLAKLDEIDREIQRLADQDAYSAK